MAPSTRIEAARSKADQLFERCVEIERIHANNRYLVYSEPFGGALVRTFAGNAYSSLRNANFGFELIRLVALWDGPSADRVSIPEVVALISDPGVLAHLRQEFDDWYGGEGDFLRGPHNDLRWRRSLRAALGLAGATMRSDRLKRMRRYRDKFLAHNLTTPHGPDPLFGYERKLRLSTHRIANALTTLLEDRGLDYDHTRELASRHAAQFWDGLSWAPPEKR